MAQFRATIQGQRGQASRLGSTKSGIEARVNGWRGGVSVRAFVDENGKDRFNIFATSGSRGARSAYLVGYVDSQGSFHLEKSE